MKKIFALLAAIGVIGVAANAQAGLQVTLTAGASSVTIVDGGAGDSDATANGILNISTVVGGYTFKTTLAASNSPGSPTIAFVNTGTNEITGSGAATVSIYASSNDFTGPVGPPNLTAQTDITANILPGTTSGNTADVSVNAYYDSTNAMSAVATGTNIGSVSEAGVATTFSKTVFQSAAVNVAPYALNLELTAVFNNAGTNAIDLDGGVRLTVPEPASMILWGSFAALGIPAAIRRRRQAA